MLAEAACGSLYGQRPEWEGVEHLASGGLRCDGSEESSGELDLDAPGAIDELAPLWHRPEALHDSTGSNVATREESTVGRQIVEPRSSDHLNLAAHAAPDVREQRREFGAPQLPATVVQGRMTAQVGVVEMHRTTFDPRSSYEKHPTVATSGGAVLTSASAR